MNRLNAVSLERSGQKVETFLSAFGGIKETRLTATLGYLISRAPRTLGKLFLPSRERLTKVILEEREEGKRIDILLKGSRTLVLIEAKISQEQFPRQILKYVSLVRKKYKGEFKKFKLVLLDSGGESSSPKLRFSLERLPRGWRVGFVDWNDVGAACSKASKSKKMQKSDPFVAGALKDFSKHLAISGMGMGADKEIYVRDVSGKSLSLFFQRRIYKCQPRYYKSASQALYFAPYFTRRAPGDFSSQSIVNIEPGISYIAKIVAHRKVAKNKGEILSFLREMKWPDAKKAAQEIFKQHSEKEIAILLLGKPYRLLMAPITKGRLGLIGPMGPKFYSFEELLEAANVGK